MKELKLSDKNIDVLLNFADAIVESEIKILKELDVDFKYSVEEYDEMFQEIFDIIVDIKGEC